MNNSWRRTKEHCSTQLRNPDTHLYRQYFGQTGKIKYLQVLLLEQLVDSFTNNHHGMAKKHPGTAKVIQQSRKKLYIPGPAASAMSTNAEMHANQNDGQQAAHSANDQHF